MREKFLKPFLITMMNKMKEMKIDLQNTDIEQLVNSIPMYRNMIRTRTEEIAKDLTTQTISDMKKFTIGHAFQSDASTDVKNINSAIRENC